MISAVKNSKTKLEEGKSFRVHVLPSIYGDLPTL